MKKHDRAWHEQDMADEVKEYQEAGKFVEKWSELSDIVYTYTRARWSGHKELTFPLSGFQYFFGTLYMIPKYTFRWLFFRRAGKRAGANSPIREVRNPIKIHKVVDIAERHGCDPDEFQKICQKQLAYWPLLK